MAAVGSKQIREAAVKRFQAAPAPMTAKCIIRDEIMVAVGLNEFQASEIAAAIVVRLAAYEYHVEQAQD